MGGGRDFQKNQALEQRTMQYQHRPEHEEQVVYREEELELLDANVLPGGTVHEYLAYEDDCSYTASIQNTMTRNIPPTSLVKAF